jgi:hypothetical protein
MQRHGHLAFARAPDAVLLGILQAPRGDQGEWSAPSPPWRTGAYPTAG